MRPRALESERESVHRQKMKVSTKFARYVFPTTQAIVAFSYRLLDKADKKGSLASLSCNVSRSPILYSKAWVHISNSALMPFHRHRDDLLYYGNLHFGNILKSTLYLAECVWMRIRIF